MIKLLLLVCISLTSIKSVRISELAKKTLSQEYHEKWAEWKEKYFPGEGDDTEVDNVESMEKFEKNVRSINEFNEEAEAEGQKFREGCNQYCAKDEDDMIDHEGLHIDDKDKVLPTKHLLKGKSFVFEEMLKSNIPYKILPEATADEVNHISLGNDLTPKNQASCGSCWAFSTMGVVESAFKIGGGDLMNLSEQALVDCDMKNGGCNGGWMPHAFNWLKSNGSTLTSVYPYTARRGSCKDTTANHVSGYKVDGYSSISNYSESQLAAAVEKQPVSVAVNASQWYKYAEGIVTKHSWCSGGLNHAVIAVGYGTDDDGTKYWIIKNSWGTGWGEGGYIRLQKEQDGLPEGMCGVATYGWYPNVTVTAEPSGDDSEKDETGPVAPEEEERSGPVAPEDPVCEKCNPKKWFQKFDCVRCKMNGAIKKKKLGLDDEEIEALTQDIWDMRNYYERKSVTSTQ